jgi:hypothetical protein
MARFWSFEETLALLGALIAMGIACKVFRMSLLVSGAVGIFTALVIAYATLFEFTLEDGVITYRNHFQEVSFPVDWVEKVGMSTHWAGLPGHLFMFVMRHPPAPLNGYFQRTGLVSWPSASKWVKAVNEAAQAAKNSTRLQQSSSQISN